MRNHLPLEHVLGKLKNIQPKMRYDGTEEFTAWQEKAYNKLWELLGLDNFEKVPLDIEIEYDKETVNGNREIRFTYASEEGYYPIARILLPQKTEKPLPVCICLQGHSLGMHCSFDECRYPEEKPGESDRDYAVRAVKEGFIAVCIDQRCLGEAGGTYPDACEGCYRPSTMNLLLGRTTIGSRVWDVMRLIDALTERFTDIADVENIVITGCSGGGTGTFYSACIDRRIKAAMPHCAVCTFIESLGVCWHCSCNFIPHIAEYFDMGDLAGLIAPRKLVQVNGSVDPIFTIKGATDCSLIAEKLYKAAKVPENYRFVIGEGAHRYYADDGWKAMHELLNK